MRAIIIDDEKACRDVLQLLLSKHCPHVAILQHCSRGKEAIEAIEKLEPELIFLDIAMPDMDGFKVLENCKLRNFEIIFTTGYNDYAIKAIRYSALDYLVKPIAKNELIDAVKRAGEQKKASPGLRISDFLELLGKKRSSERIALSTMEGLNIVDTNDIVFCESENNYTRFHLQNGKTILVSKTLKKAEELLLENSNFYRIHQSYLVNMDYVRQYVKGDGAEVIMSNGKRLSVSRSQRTGFISKLEKML